MQTLHFLARQKIYRPPFLAITIPFPGDNSTGTIFIFDVPHAFEYCETAQNTRKNNNFPFTDDSIPTASVGIPNSEQGHCRKTVGILRYVADEIRTQPQIKWIVVADDDTILRLFIGHTVSRVYFLYFLFIPGSLIRSPDANSNCGP